MTAHLRTGFSIPLVGLGTYKIVGDDASSFSISQADFQTSLLERKRKLLASQLFLVINSQIRSSRRYSIKFIEETLQNKIRVEYSFEFR